MPFNQFGEIIPDNPGSGNINPPRRSPNNFNGWWIVILILLLISYLIINSLSNSKTNVSNTLDPVKANNTQYLTPHSAMDNNGSVIPDGEKSVDSVIDYLHTASKNSQLDSATIDSDLFVGEKFQGGIIFYLDSSRKHGLVSALKDHNEWCQFEDAKKACATLSLNGYSNWRLPTINELKELYKQKNIAGNFIEYMYWSSSPIDKNHNWSFYFGFKTEGGEVKDGHLINSRFRVRAIRDF